MIAQLKICKNCKKYSEVDNFKAGGSFNDPYISHECCLEQAPPIPSNITTQLAVSSKTKTWLWDVPKLCPFTLEHSVLQPEDIGENNGMQAYEIDREV